MSDKNKLAKSKPPSTVAYLDIGEIKDDVVVMKDGTLRSVLICSSVNFALKSEDEQNATIQAYVGFLNSLEFPIQIVIQSRKLNIDGYLDKLKAAEKQQTNELLRVQIGEYVAYIKELISLGDIMTKRFYVVVPYNPSSDARRGFWQRFKAVLSAAGMVKLSRDQFTRYTEALEQRVNYVSSGLASVGVKAVRLDTQSLIELYYNTYNPEIRETEKMNKIEDLKVETV
jgi:hypothetical protein